MKPILLILSLMFLLGNANAQQSKEIKTAPWFVEKFSVTAGFFVPTTTSTIEVGIKGSVQGSHVDLEKDLGYNSDVFTFMASAQWRISRRSRLAFTYYNIPRSSTHTLKKDIVFKGDTFHVNATVNSFFNTAIYQISYGYAILSKPNYELGVMIGTHLVGGKVGLSLTGTVGSGSKSSDFGFTAPLPDLGIWGGYAFSKRLAANLELDYLSLTVGSISGSIFAYNLLVRYRLISKLDVSLGIAGLNFNLDAEKNNVQGHFEWGYNGPALGFTYSFGKTSWNH